MTSQKTTFAGLTAIPPGEPLSDDGFAFQWLDRFVLDRLARIGAVTHKHDAHLALPNPGVDPTVSVPDTGGVIPADTPIYVCYTLMDSDGGETLPSNVVQVTTQQGFDAPTVAPNAVVDYGAGALMAGVYTYFATVTDGVGGETVQGPPVVITVDPGHANAEVTLSNLMALVASSNLSNLDTAGWRLWRQLGGGPPYLIASGLGVGGTGLDTFVDDGVIGDCTVAPPFSNTTAGTSMLVVTVPSGQPTGAVNYSIYASLDGSFTSPSRLGLYPISDAGTIHQFTDLTVQDGAPPPVSLSFPGASKLYPDDDFLFGFKSPVATYNDLPAGVLGDARLVIDTKHIYMVFGETAVGPSDWTDVTPGVIVSGAQTQGAWVAVRRVAFPPGDITDFTKVGTNDLAVVDGALTLADPNVPLVPTFSADDPTDFPPPTKHPYAYQWTSVGQFADGQRLRAHVTGLNRFGGDTNWNNFAVVCNMAGDGVNGLAWYLDQRGGAGFTTDLTDLIYELDFFPTVEMSADPTDRTKPVHNPDGSLALVSAVIDPTTDTGFKEMWLDIWRDGNIVYGAVYTADPLAGNAPAFVSNFDMTGNAAYVAGVAGYFGIVWTGGNQHGGGDGKTQGFAELEVLPVGPGPLADWTDEGGGATLQVLNDMLVTTDPRQTDAVLQGPLELNGILTPTPYVAPSGGPGQAGSNVFELQLSDWNDALGNPHPAYQPINTWPSGDPFGQEFSVATTADVAAFVAPSGHNNPGDLLTVTDTGPQPPLVANPNIYVWDGAAWQLFQEYVGPQPMPSDVQGAPELWNFHHIGRPAPAHPNAYVYRWTGGGQWADGYKFRVYFKNPARLVPDLGGTLDNGGFDGSYLADIGLVMNMTDKDNGLTYYLGGWTKKPTDLMRWGTHYPPERVQDDGTYCHPGEHPLGGTPYVDMAPGFTEPGMEFADIHGGGGQATVNLLSLLDLNHPDLWLEVWREGDVAKAAIYNTDPDSGQAPVHTSTFAGDLGGTPFAAGTAGYFGIVLPYLNELAGIADVRVLELSTNTVVAELGPQSAMSFDGPGVSVDEVGGVVKVTIAPATVASSRRTHSGELQSDDSGTVIEYDSPDPGTLVLQKGAFKVGTYMEVTQVGAGAVSVEADADVILHPASPVTTTAQWQSIGLRQRKVDEWVATRSTA